jgi:nicotinamide mononucleotide adenylyltransferase
LIFCDILFKIVVRITKSIMATRTYHISFPIEWAKAIEKEMKEEHYTPSEYFKHLYRQMRRARLMADIRESEKDFEKGRIVEANSLEDLV